MRTTLLGRSTSRVDGRAKVTGAARYAAEFHAPGLTHGVIVSSAIARGKILRIDATAALALPGVLHVFTHENRPHLPWFDRSWRDDDAPPGSPFRPLYSGEIQFSQQPIALVVAETLELARYASSLVQVEYETAAHSTNLEAERANAHPPRGYAGGRQPPPKARGDAQGSFESAMVKVDVEYHMPVEHHNPMEMHASTVVWEEDGRLTVYDKTQGVQNSHTYVTQVFNLSAEKVRVISPFVGGAFGSGLRPQYQLFFAMLAALELKRSVCVSLTRQQMFTFGHRPETIQRIALGASAWGELQAMIHEVIAETSQFEDYIEVVSNWSGLLYKSPNVRFDHQLVSLDFNTPLDMRAPGAAWGALAIECAMDELAHAAKLDPLELRLRNYAEEDANDGKPFSSKELRACYSQAAERFGWSQRKPEPRSMREGRQLIGWGMATGAWEAAQQEASARAVLSVDGSLVVSSATADIGTGTYTVMTQIAAEVLGLPMEAVTFKLGDTALPPAPLEGGSWTVATVGSAVKSACTNIARQLWEAARKLPGSPLAHTKFEGIQFSDRRIHLKEDEARGLTLTEVMRGAGTLSIDVTATTGPDQGERKRYSCYSHSAVFVEVRVDEDLGKIQVTRMVSAIAGGRVLNPKTARSQIIGGQVWGLGMALEEVTHVDHELGRFMNHNLSEYHVPVSADVRDLEVIFVEEHDEHVNALGAKGLGEIGIVGTAAAVANAVFHATGKRVRRFPITLDALL